MANVTGTGGDDFIHISGDGRTPPAGKNDIPGATQGDDVIEGGLGDDAIFGGDGDDRAIFNITTDGADRINLGSGMDVVEVDADAATQVRLTFTSAEVGNGDARDSGTMANQDGGLAVRMQAEDASGALTGRLTRTDDEGVTYVGGEGVTFDVRDLVSGAARGDQFKVVTLGSSDSERLVAVDAARSYYINGGGGNDTVIGGIVDDFLVGGAGDDSLVGAFGDDSFIGGGGDDTIIGGAGDNVVTHNITTDGADSVNLKAGDNVMNVNASAPTQVRLTFTSSEVGNGEARDSGTMPNQDGGLAVRMQAEDGSGALTGPITRVSDEGVNFIAGAGVTFDVRDLVSGVARGDQFEVVTLGTARGDLLTAVAEDRPYYINGGGGDDTVIGGLANDFLVGGAGNDRLVGVNGNDSFIGGGGDDTIVGGAAANVATHNVTTDGADQVDLGGGGDVMNVNANAPGQVRLTFTSAEVGNGSQTDSNTMPNQDGGLAVRMQAEDGSGALAGPITRVGDEAITFVAGTGVTFDVRDLVSGVARGDQFEVVMLGTQDGERMTALQTERPYYINAGQGDDTLVGGDDNDFLVGGAGADRMVGGLGNDSYIVDNAGDRVVERAGGGTDTVLTGLDYRIGREIENLTLTGTADVDGTGNRLDNVVTGNVGANVLDGGLGSDTLTGGAGADTFAFTTALGADNVDVVTDFSVADDTLGLSSAIFAELGLGRIDRSELSFGKARDESDRIIYDRKTGELFYDADGSGSGSDAVLFARLEAGLALTTDDFLVG